MTRSRTLSTTTWSAPTARLLVLLMLVRAMVPVGFMPDMSAAEGVFRIVICAGDGVMKVDDAARGETPDAPGLAGDACPYVALGSAVVVPQAAGVPLGPDGGTSAVPALSANTLDRGAEVPALGARAPPGSV
jgi:hypothetical protein